MDFVDRVHGTGFPEIRPWRPLSAIPVEFVDIVAGTESFLHGHRIDGFMQTWQSDL